MSSFRLPGRDNRTAVVGSTGSGKSQFAVGLLSTRDFHIRPWVIFDPKNDSLIAELDATELPRGSKPPTDPGLYVIHPLPDVDDAWVEGFMLQCWMQENIGLLIDELYMISRYSKSFKFLLTQGRSKHIEMIMCSQRPAWCHPMSFSESDFLSVFRLNKPEDRKTMQDAMSLNIKERLPQFNSYWYDVGRDKGFILTPAPSRDELIQRFRARLGRKVRMI
jgi:hypothetical protein